MSVLLVLPAKPALADPHAVYYTATAQQQLFFNVLAALNQADYVELSGASAGSQRPIDRAGLVGRRERDTAGTGSEQHTFITQTRTDLSSLISRLVTLEGFDLYSDYLIRQLAAEKTRIASGEELAEVACERVFGKPGCKEEAKTEAEKRAQLEAEAKAFIKDPLEWEAWPLMYGAVPALFSGDETIEKLRGQIAAGKIAFANPTGAANSPAEPGEEPLHAAPQVPFAYSPELAALRQRLEASSEPADKLLLRQIEYLANQIAASMFGVTQWQPGAQPDFSHLSGAVRSSGQANRTAADVLRQTFVNLDLPTNMQRIAQAAAARVATQQQLIQVDGSRANVKVVAARDKPPSPFFKDLLKPQGGKEEDPNGGKDETPAGPLGELTLELTGPPALRRAELDAAVNYGHAADVGQQYGPPYELYEEGTGDVTEGGGVGEVLGVTSAGQGQVLGDQADEDIKDNPVPLTVNPKPAHAQGMYGRMLALIIDQPELRKAASLPECGYSGCPPAAPAPPASNP